MPRRLRTAYSGRPATVAVALIVIATVVAYALLDNPLDLLTPTIAMWLRWFNVTTAAIAFAGLMIIVTPRWSTYASPFRDAIATLLIYLFIIVGGTGRALALGAPPNEFAVAVALANVGALRILYRSVHGDYAAFRRPDAT